MDLLTSLEAELKVIIQNLSTSNLSVASPEINYQIDRQLDRLVVIRKNLEHLKKHFDTYAFLHLTKNKPGF